MHPALHKQFDYHITCGRKLKFVSRSEKNVILEGQNGHIFETTNAVYRSLIGGGYAHQPEGDTSLECPTRLRCYGRRWHFTQLSERQNCANLVCLSPRLPAK